MQDSFEMKGVWWLPNAEDKKLPGTLSFSQEDGIYLEIVGVFGSEFIDTFDKPKIILGESVQSRPITLTQCFKVGGTLPFMKKGDAKYRVQFVFDGIHFSTQSDIKLHRLFGSYTDLDAWVYIYGFTIDKELVAEEIIYKIGYQKPSSQSFDVDDDFKVGISFASFGPKTSIVQNDVQITQRSYLFVESKKDDISFDKLFTKLNTFLYFVQLALQRVPYPLSIVAHSSINRKTLNNGKEYYPEINIYYTPIEAIRSQKLRIPHEMLFTFHDLEAVQIKKWFGSFDKYQTVIHLYRGLFYSDRLFIQTKFLNIAQALESLHSIQCNYSGYSTTADGMKGAPIKALWRASITFKSCLRTVEM